MWDEELDRLAQQVINDVGDDALQPAFACAVAAALNRTGLMADDGSTRWTSSDAFHDALKTEFRRLVQRH